MKRGFTLIELVIAVAIVALLGTSIVSAHISLNIKRKRVIEQIEVNRRLQNAAELCSARIKNDKPIGEIEKVVVKTEDLGKFVKLTVSTEDGHELKKIVQKGIHPN